MPGIKTARSGPSQGIGSKFYDPSGMGPSRVVVHQMTRKGALGSPEKATAEKGGELLALITGVLVEFLKEFPQWRRASLA